MIFVMTAFIRCCSMAGFSIGSYFEVTSVVNTQLQ
jgi:hypothetical protein